MGCFGHEGYKEPADIGDGRGEYVASVGCPSVERRNANTRLIAAAPDLYRNAVTILFAYDMDDAFAVDALEGLRQAIAKAEGES